MPLTPDDFKADLTEEDFQTLRPEVRAEQVRKMRAMEFTVREEAGVRLAPGELVWLEVPQEGIDGRFLVVSAEPTHHATRYTLVGQGSGRRRPGEKVIRIERLRGAT